MKKISIASIYRAMATGGDENRLLTFVRNLDKTRFSFTLILVFPPDAPEIAGPIFEQFRDLGVPIVVLEENPGRWEKPWLRTDIARSTVEVVTRLARVLRERDIDVLDARLAPSIPLAVLGGILAKTPAVIAAQYNFSRCRSLAWRFFAQLLWPLLDLLVCDSEVRLNELLKAIWLAPKGTYIPNGIDAPIPEVSEAEMRIRLGLPPKGDCVVIGQIGTLWEFKGFLVLVEAVAGLLAKRRDVFLLICGFSRDPAYRERLDRRVDELGIRSKVLITPYSGPIGDIWQLFDIHSHASFFDSSPQTVVESMALGKPAVLSRVGGMPAMVEEGVTTLMVEPRDVAALESALLSLVDSEELRRKLGTAGRRRYEQCFTSDRMVRQLELAISDVVENGGNTRQWARRVLRPFILLLTRAVALATSADMFAPTRQYTQAEVVEAGMTAKAAESQARAAHP